MNNDLANCFQSVSNGKSSVASAIADQGIEIAEDATFDEFATSIRDIQNADQYRLSIIDSLSNTNLSLTPNSTWQDIFNGLNSLFPESLTIAGISISGSSRSGAGKWHYKSSTKFDITHFNTLSYVLSLNTSGGGANCKLYYEGGSVSLSAGSKTIDVSSYTGESYFQVGQQQVYHSNGDYTSGGAANLSSIKLKV